MRQGDGKVSRQQQGKISAIFLFSKPLLEKHPRQKVLLELSGFRDFGDSEGLVSGSHFVDCEQQSFTSDRREIRQKWVSKSSFILRFYLRSVLIFVHGMLFLLLLTALSLFLNSILIFRS